MIPGITDRNRLPRLAKIRLGEKRESKGGKDYPAALDHFSFVDCPEVEAVYGNECKELFPVIFPSDDEEVSFPTARKAYGTGGLICACRDGVTATRVVTDKADPQLDAYCKERGITPGVGEMIEFPCPGQDCPWDQQGLCKPLGRLMFLLPNVPKFGFYEICTTSFNSMVNVLSVMRSMKSIVGRVSGIPFALKLVEQQVQPKGMKSKIVHVLALEVREKLADLVAAGKRLSAGSNVPLLPEAVDDVPDDLVPHGGALLDATLAGEAPPPGEPSRLKGIVAEVAAAPAPIISEAKLETITANQALVLIGEAKKLGYTEDEIKAELAVEGWTRTLDIPRVAYQVFMDGLKLKKQNKKEGGF